MSACRKLMLIALPSASLISFLVKLNKLVLPESALLRMIPILLLMKLNVSDSVKIPSLSSSSMSQSVTVSDLENIFRLPEGRFYKKR